MPRREAKYMAELIPRGTHIPGVKTKKRYYAALDTAMPKALRWMMLDGKVMDVIEVSSLLSGKTVGLIRLNSKGKPDTWWEDKLVERPNKEGRS